MSFCCPIHGYYTPVPGVTMALCPACSAPSPDLILPPPSPQVESLHAEVVSLRAQLEATEARVKGAEEHAAEGWGWLDDALIALRAKDVFSIRAQAAERASVYGALRSLVDAVDGRARRGLVDGNLPSITEGSLKRIVAAADAARAVLPGEVR